MGAHGTVYHGLYKNDVVAVKCLDQVEDLTTFHREVSAMFKLQSQHTVQLLAMADLDTNQPKIIMPYMVHGDLRTHLDKRRANERTGCTLPHQAIAVAVAAALVDLHKCNVIHRDLKPQNVLLSTDNLVQVADFGIARENGLRSKTAEVGTPLYMAPEAFATSHYGTEVDVYALGVLLTELDTTLRPYSEDCVNEYALFMQVSNGRRPLLSLTCPLWYYELAHKCMAADPIDRPTAAQVHKCLSQHANDPHTTTTSGVPVIAGTDVTFVRRLSPSTELALYGSDPVVLQTVAPTLADARAYERYLGNLFTLDAQPHLVRLVGVVGGASSKLVLEFLDGGDLLTYLEQPEPRRRVSKLNLAIGMTHGLHALHAQGMVHGHLKAKHVYLTASGDVKLASFKFGHTGTFSGDIFALGNLFARVDAAYAQPSTHDPVLAFIIQRCCADEPAARPSTTDLLACLESASVA
ncbi:serine/threonine protein kinase [Saprolegnia parasitica CBS 223.65]|uniref:Serine/threonine protein kinase n=1 Tax=Saprolegnia parasitica (strain CBS 223.65) TaxID=695850 RepID=A0A067BZ92_SAPPC|nr:serine/threonine protein kinase [Saprolegnia parasitica CBS 223.65]KDO19626.1 serine/threonine protein kinase [Saprolegnia parasitica CBS 223.65]|eukprot:XP_012209674.1 serine/threonine protein kinase [Saprolegnia parasitica CBS 223.65]